MSVEIVRRMSSSTILQSEHEVERKLQELYVYSDMGKSFESDAITHAVKKSLKVIEDEIPPPGKRLGNLKSKHIITSDKVSIFAHFKIVVHFFILILLSSYSKNVKKRSLQYGR